MATLSQIRAAEKKMAKAQNVIQRYVDNHGEPVTDEEMAVHTQMAGELHEAIVEYLALLNESSVLDAQVHLKKSAAVAR